MVLCPDDVADDKYYRHNTPTCAIMTLRRARKHHAMEHTVLSSCLFCDQLTSTRLTGTCCSIRMDGGAWGVLSMRLVPNSDT